MKRADIKVGFSCNNSCKFCVQGDKRKKFGDKTLDQIKKNIKDAKKTCKGLVLTGGEPTIRKDFLEIVSFAKKTGFKLIQIQTNGRMFAYNNFCKQLIKAGATEFSPALHGHIENLHDYLTGAQGSFKQVIQGIKNLKKLNQTVITNTVITKPNYRHLPQIAKLLSDLRVEQFQLAFVHALGSAMDNFNSIVPRKSLIEPFVKKAMDVGTEAGINSMTEAIPFCFMCGYEKYIAENIIPDTEIYDYDVVINDFTKERQSVGKVKGEQCKKCKKNDVCEGPWREYPENFGWSEFKTMM